MSERVTVAIEGGVADVRLNRPEKMNALDPEMFEALTAAGRRLSEDPAVRVAVISGEGRAFCSGLDFGSFARMAGGGADGDGGAETTSAVFREGVGDANFAQSASWVWHEAPMPVIAAVHGVAFGGGLQIALGADLRFVAPDARLSVLEVKWGLIPDMAGPQRLRYLVREDVAKELTFTGRIVDGAEAVAIGLATRVEEDPRAAALALAAELAAKSPHALRAAKKLLNEVPRVSEAEGLQLEEHLQRSLIGSANQVEAVKANFEKRAAAFADVDL
ncbi:MAG: crotonase/enoyl-CoA hydratase family protein [Thermoanaerobaculia bacterium]|nr:crotonase/enoyl-CoA hydratase family protein [Thermoanaerobaculia bacterium]